jgi:flagellar hook-associated protein 1 FlgK
MGGILNIGTQALLANQTALQTTGNNISNANTVGYSRQSAILTTVAGQYTGAGFIGEGVAVQTITRNYDAYLTRQATLTSSAQAGDQARATNLQQIENLFSGGTNGLGSAISNMLNSFSDVASAPTDLTARTVALTNVSETAARIRGLSGNLDDLQSGTTQSLTQMVASVNNIAQSIASVNANIAKAQASGQPPNDLLDKRDQLIHDLNQLVQTTSIPAPDGTVGVFIAGSQPLVLGTTTATVALTKDAFSDPLSSKLTINRQGQSVELDENALGGGQVPALLKFNNADLTQARNMLGRLTLATTTAMNDQQKLGLDMNGQPGGDLFSPVTLGSSNILAQTVGNTGNATLGLAVNDVTKFVPSNYEVDFTSATTGTITRLSDGVVTAFPQTPPTTAPVMATVDGLDFQNNSTAPASAAAGDRFLIKPFSTAAGSITGQFSSPRSLAVASPVAVAASPTNTGSLTINSLTAQNLATPIDNYTVTFAVSGGVATYSIADTTAGTTPVVSAPYVPGQAITYAPAGIAGWSLSLTGAPANGDSMSITPNAYSPLDGGNATAIMNLRDKPMFDGANLTDGYAGMIAQLGTQAQSANYTAQVSTNLASTAASAQASVSGVNLDEEASKLIQYQQAYQASAKMIQIAETIFTSLISGLGP